MRHSRKRKVKALFVVLFFLFTVDSFSQKVINCTSDPKTFELKPVYKKGLPPAISVKLYLLEENGNGILDSGEKGELRITLENNGQGPAQGVRVFIDNPDSVNNSFDIHCTREINYIFPEKSVQLNFPLLPYHSEKNEKHRLVLKFEEEFGFQPDSAVLSFYSQKTQYPEITFCGIAIRDTISQVNSSKKNGKIQPGEKVSIEVYLQNTGKVTANNLRYQIYSTDPDVQLSKRSGEMQDIKPGAVGTFSFLLDAENCESPDNNLWVYLNLTHEKSQDGTEVHKLPVYMNTSPPAIETRSIPTDSLLPSVPVASFAVNPDQFTVHYDQLIEIHNLPLARDKKSDAVGIIFGIEKYDQLHFQPYAENDAEIMKEYFSRVLGIQNVVSYTSSQARNFIFHDVFGQDNGGLKRIIKPGQTDIFIYYSGHGLPSADGDNIYLVPATGDPQNLKFKSYNLNTLFQDLDSLNARSVTLFLDVGFSGESRHSPKFNAKALIPMDIVRNTPLLSESWKNNPTYRVFLAGKPGETMFGKDESQTGLFTYYLCAGLKGHADTNADDKITTGELYDYLKSSLKKACSYEEWEQIPQFFGDSGVVLVFL